MFKRKSYKTLLLQCNTSDTIHISLESNHCSTNHIALSDIQLRCITNSCILIMVQSILCYFKKRRELNIYSWTNILTYRKIWWLEVDAFYTIEERNSTIRWFYQTLHC